MTMTTTTTTTTRMMTHVHLVSTLPWMMKMMTPNLKRPPLYLLKKVTVLTLFPHMYVVTTQMPHLPIPKSTIMLRKYDPIGGQKRYDLIIYHTCL